MIKNKNEENGDVAVSLNCDSGTFLNYSIGIANDVDSNKYDGYRNLTYKEAKEFLPILYATLSHFLNQKRIHDINNTI